MIQTTLVTGLTAAERENAIASVITSLADTAIILEGLPSATGPIGMFGNTDAHLRIARIAPGCVCCSGNLTMRVTLNRMLRSKPARLFIGIASASHLAQIRAFLSSPPYDQLLQLTEEIRA